MLDGHLHPNRGWDLIRGNGEFAAEEVDHLKDCPQCRRWVSLFAEVAWNTGATQETDSPFYVVADEHISAERGWLLIRDRGRLELHEVAHLQYCHRCNDWL